MHPMRRKDRLLSEEAAMRILQDGEYGVLSLLTPEGTPYGVPLTYALEQGERLSLYIHCARDGRKLDCLKAGKAAHFVVVGATRVVPQRFSIEYESVMLEGTLCEVTGEEEKLHGLLCIAGKYSAAFDGAAYAAAAGKATRVLRLDVESMSGKRLQETSA
ncbi:MAG TPA: pyridoxamine 5'-phosphate oxidase family protein [Candidatus Desulfovibrio gallistercoris]|nr:pyridoxamine 5'-phosphate oxidase family protein [Candidatus Desulfovibrio gallistercoris]